MQDLNPDEVEQVLRRIVEWAEGRPDVRALALVGSYARGTAAGTSDVDIILLTTCPEVYIDSDDWVEQLGNAELVATRNWGGITERRLRAHGGLEIDLGIGSPAWASTTPIDPGTARVVSSGMTALHDPMSLLRALQDRLV